MITDYTKQAEDLLQSFGVVFKAELIGSACPNFCDDARKGVDMGKVNTYPRKTHIHGRQYRCIITRTALIERAGKLLPHGYKLDKVNLIIDFWNSYADEEENFFAYGQPGEFWKESSYWDKYRVGKRYPGVARLVAQKRRNVPTPYGVLACLTKSEPGTFEEFCSDYGYDSDSRRAEEVWRAAREEWRKVQGFFSADEIAKLQEVA